MLVALLHIREERTWAPGFQETLDALNDGARDAVTSLGWDAVLVASAQVPVSVSRAIAAEADAVVVLGGEDVAPEFYGGPADYPGAGSHEPLADAAHVAVVRDSLAARRPLLGICRGHQILNIALGGTLIAHLPTTANHRGAGPGDASFVACRAALPADGPLAGDVDVRDRLLCTHHQAVGRLGRGLRVAARADDGVVEAIVHESAPLTGVQWHPEHPAVARRQLTRLLLRLERQARFG